MTLSHDDLCRLSQVFCDATGPASGQDIRINGWLNEMIAAAASGGSDSDPHVQTLLRQHASPTPSSGIGGVDGR